MKRRLLALVAGVTSLMIVMSGPALAVIPGTEDQHQDNHADTTFTVANGATNALAQTFTAGMTGNLVAVSIYVDSIFSTPTFVGPNVADGVTVEIRTTASDVPTSTVLSTTSVVLASDQWNDIVLTSAAAITSGTKYALVVYPDAGQSFRWAGSNTAGDYTGGAAMVLDTTWKSVAAYTDDGSTIAQFAFRTYVSTPTASPTTTVPPTTAESAPSAPSNGSALPLLLAGAFGVIAYVTIRRKVLVRR